MKRFVAGTAIIILLILAIGAGWLWKSGKLGGTDYDYRFVVMGDSRGSGDIINEKILRGIMGKLKEVKGQPEFILFSGDMVSGNTDVAKELAQWNKVTQEYYPAQKFFPALGNHEHDETIFSNAFQHLPNEQLQGYQKSAYYFDYGNARFITLNTERKEPYYNVVKKEQLIWLESLLKDNGKNQVFVQFHYPAFPVGQHFGESLDGMPAQRDELWSILDKYKVTAVIVGHEHNYNRRTIDSSFSANGFTFRNNIQQITVGGAGAPLNNKVKDNKGVSVGPINTYHYMVVDVKGTKSRFTVYDQLGNKIDQFEVEKP